MPNIVKQEIDNLNAVLTMTITKADYLPALDEELKKFSKKANLKGFRKGKVPKGVIRKMYGQSILADVINNTMQRELSKYLIDEKIEILGQPLPSDDQEEMNLDINDLGDFEFIFDLGIQPEFELKGVSADSTFNRYSVQINSDLIDTEMENARKRFGERSEAENDIEDNDIVSFNAEELDDDKIKENGWATTFKILVSKIVDEDIKKELLTKKKGDKIRFDVTKMEENNNPEHIRKYLLNVTDADVDVEIGDHFEATIEEVQRLGLATLNQDFFDKAFGEGNVKSEEEAKSKFEEDIVKYYDKQAESLLFRDFQDALLEQNEIPLPDAFLKRWIKASNENATDSLIDAEYDSFSKNLQWSLIKGKIVKQFDLSVSEEEIFEGFKERIRGYFQGYGDELIVLNTANRLMEDKKQVDQLYQELMSDKLFESVRDIVKIEDQKISNEDFDKVIQEAHEAIQNKSSLTEGSNTSSTEDETSEETTEEVTEEA